MVHREALPRGQDVIAVAMLLNLSGDGTNSPVWGPTRFRAVARV
jgi:hypothetical protein